jgi:hypothetical protein
MKYREPDSPILAVVLLLSLMGIALNIVVLIADGEWSKVLAVLTLFGCMVLFFRYNR